MTKPGPVSRGSGAEERLSAMVDACDAYLVSDVSAAEDAPIPARQLLRLLEISRAMNRIHSRDELLCYVGDRLRELFDAENSFVILLDDQGQPRIQSSHVEEPVDDSRPISDTILRRVLAARDPILIDNTAELDELRNQSSIERFKIASVLCAPLVVADQVIGALQFDHRGDPHPFSDGDRRLLALFADQAATAFNNLELIERINRALNEVEIAHARMVKAERLSALGQMAAGIAHDFNNTLFVALGFCDVLLSRDSLETEVRSSLERIRTCALDAASTVRRLHVFARGRPADSRLESVDCRGIAEEMPEFTRHKWYDEARRTGVSIRMVTNLRPTPSVAASPADIREVLTNLIFNAVDAIQDEGVVEVSSGFRDGRVFVAVRDTGVGMDETVEKRVFEPFYTTKGTRGCGFGLSVCWSIAQRLGGEVEADSRPGEGSTFTLWLPPATSEGMGEEELESSPNRGAAVMVIDDDPDVLAMVRQLVESLGHRVTSFTTPEQALRSLDEGQYDLVVSDLGMPSMNGYEVAREVRRMKPDIPVVILTGWGSDNAPDDDHSRSVAAVLPKPITRDALRVTLNDALAGRL